MSGCRPVGAGSIPVASVFEKQFKKQFKDVIAWSSNGRMADFDSADSGSSPGRAVKSHIGKSWGIGTPPVSKTGKPLAMQVRILSLPLLSVERRL